MEDISSQIEIEGQIEGITYSNEETGYTVARLLVEGYRAPVTVVGYMIAPAPGEILQISGNWTHHPRFGRQIKIKNHRVKVPATARGIKKYLGSGLIRGIGPVMASRIVTRFGEKTLEVIQNRTDDLAEIEGIGPKRVEMIRKAWEDQKEIRDVMIFLQSHGVGSGFATRIFKQYGHDSLSVLHQNPYRLASDVHGIGFNTADRIAEKLGFEKSAPVRAEAGILYIMDRLAEEGHVYFPYDLFVEKCVEILKVDKEILRRAFDRIVHEKKIITEDLHKDLAESRPDSRAVYLPRFYVSETGIAESMSMLMSGRKIIRKVHDENAVTWAQEKIGLRLAQAQVEAVKRAVSDKIMVITGGPGTGKTTIIKAVLNIYRKLGAKILLAAPTGRASKRMSEATGYPAKTIHRMLEFSIQKGGFQKDRNHPLDADVLILDEVSMIDTILMHHLLKAVPERASLILVGDVDQLPSVGAGNVLGDIIRSGVFPVVKLNEIFRQAGKSKIIVNAHKINNGIIPELKQANDDLGDFYFIEQEDPDQVLPLITELVSKRIPTRFNLDPVDHIQVLSPMHKGTVGTGNLNDIMQEVLNSSTEMLVRGDRKLKLHDKVMQIRNNYEKQIFNGDIGRITAIDPENQKVTVNFDHFPVDYDYSELDEIMLAYAISVHKSQGSEYPAVILTVLSQHYVLLQRNLIYTAVTRGKRLVVIVGSKKALSMGIKNDRTQKRYTHLEERLRSRFNSRPV